VIELLVAGAGWLLGHPGWSLALAAWAVAVALVLLGGVVLARGVLVWGVAALAGTLAFRILRGDVAAGGRKGKVWRGRHSPLYERHVAGQSPAWRATRVRVLARAGGRCEGCGRVAPALDVHHLPYDRLGRERLADLKALCDACHLKAHGRRRWVARPRSAAGTRRTPGTARGGKGGRAGRS